MSLYVTLIIVVSISEMPFFAQIQYLLIKERQYTVLRTLLFALCWLTTSSSTLCYFFSYFHDSRKIYLNIITTLGSRRLIALTLIQQIETKGVVLWSLKNNCFNQKLSDNCVPLCFRWVKIRFSLTNWVDKWFKIKFDRNFSQSTFPFAVLNAALSPYLRIIVNNKQNKIIRFIIRKINLIRFYYYHCNATDNDIAALFSNVCWWSKWKLAVFRFLSNFPAYCLKINYQWQYCSI